MDDIGFVVLTLGCVAMVCFGCGVATIIGFQRSARRDSLDYLQRTSTPHPDAQALAESERRAREAEEEARNRQPVYYANNGSTTSSGTESMF